MEGECSTWVEQETPFKSVFIVAQAYARQYEGVLYEVKIKKGSGEIMGGRRGGAVVGEEDRPPLIHPVNKICGKRDVVPPHSCHLVAVRFNGLSKLYMLVAPRIAPSQMLTKPELKGRIFDTETKTFDTFAQPESFNRCSYLISAYNKLYHLGTGDGWRPGKPGIELERYDPCTDCWQPLASVPLSLYQGRGCIAGYAVYGNSILISLSDRKGFIGFNVKENKWYPVSADQSFGFVGRAVVVGNTIYALSANCRTFTKFSFQPATRSISETRRLVGFDLPKQYMSYEYFERRSEYVVHLGGLDFCLVKTAADCNCRDRQPVWVTTFQIVRRGGGESSIHTLDSTVYDVDLKGRRNFLIGFSFTPDCQDNEPVGEEEETKGAVEKRCGKRKGHRIKPTAKIRTKRKSRKCYGLCLKRGLITWGQL